MVPRSAIAAHDVPGRMGFSHNSTVLANKAMLHANIETSNVAVTLISMVTGVVEVRLLLLLFLAVVMSFMFLNHCETTVNIDHDDNDLLEEIGMTWVVISLESCNVLGSRSSVASVTDIVVSTRTAFPVVIGIVSSGVS